MQRYGAGALPLSVGRNELLEKNNISADMNTIFIKIQQMQDALKVGQRYKKETQKARDKLENN